MTEEEIAAILSETCEAEWQWRDPAPRTELLVGESLASLGYDRAKGWFVGTVIA